MKFAHMADVHLGLTPDKQMPWAKERAQAIFHTFKKAIARIKEEGCLFLFISGDLFHRPPTLGQLKEVNYLFSTLAPCQVVLVAGNHDFITKGLGYDTFAFAENVFIFKTQEISSIEFFSPQPICIWGLSYYSREIKEPLYDTLKAPSDGRLHILLAHGGDDKHIPINQKKLLASGFHYIALGHIHKPEAAENGQYAYSGSLEPTDLNDTGKRGFIIGDLTQGQRTLHFVPMAAYEYIPLKVLIQPDLTVNAITDQVNLMLDDDPHHLYKITFTGKRDPDIKIPTDDLALKGRILSVTDQTEPDYDLLQLQKEHNKDLIGQVIQTLSADDTLSRKALYYCLDALLNS